MQRIAHLISGESASNPDARVSPVFNPATGEQSAELELASTTTVEEAIKKADAAFGDWSARTPINRARIMFRYKQLLEDNKEELAARHRNCRICLRHSTDDEGRIFRQCWHGR